MHVKLKTECMFHYEDRRTCFLSLLRVRGKLCAACAHVHTVVFFFFVWVAAVVWLQSFSQPSTVSLIEVVEEDVSRFWLQSSPKKCNFPGFLAP
jgi:hypothetical protein